MGLARLLASAVYSFGVLKARKLAHRASLVPGGQGGVEAAIVVIVGDDGTAGVAGIGVAVTVGVGAAGTGDIDL